MRPIYRLFSCLVLFLAIAAVPVLPARAAETCPFISAQELAGAMPALKWSLISNQDGRGCIYQAGRGDTMMLTVFRNPDKDRARELYATFVKTLLERMPLSEVSGIGMRVGKGRPLAVVHARSPEQVSQAAEALRAATVLAERPVSPPPIVHEIAVDA